MREEKPREEKPREETPRDENPRDEARNPPRASAGSESNKASAAKTSHPHKTVKMIRRISSP